jgi:alkanesulfonate monooxygenase SsuD/methylene tetrahydromethanopterin reductase-like flavin-dependent oxidoreductase (luciferase family)
MPPLGISISPFSGLPYAQFAALAREAEEAGFSGVFVPEGPNDVMLCCYAIAKATSRITIGSWIANVYFREPVLCAASAEMIQSESGGRFILGLGVSHRPALNGLGIEMGDARGRLRKYIEMVRKGNRGEPVSALGMRLRKPSTPVPIYFGALVKETARLGGELADGLMLHLAWPERMRTEIDAAYDEALKHGRDRKALAITMGLPVFIDDNRERALGAARRGLAFFFALPFYNRMLARNGFAAEANGVARGFGQRDIDGAAAAISEKLIDAVAVAGPVSRCLERIEEYRRAGAQLPIIVPNVVNEDYSATVRKCIKAFASAA